MSSHRYSVQAYDALADPRAQRLFDWLINYSAQHDGRRASRAEMRQALDLHRDQLNDLMQTLNTVGLLEFEDDKRGLARFYRLPGARWDHPHLATLAARQAFTVGSTLNP
jgi:DNA-binding IclR family transcriptional regulator